MNIVSITQDRCKAVANEYVRKYTELCDHRRSLWKELKALPYYRENESEVYYSLVKIASLRKRKIVLSRVRCPMTKALLLQLQAVELEAEILRTEWARWGARTKKRRSAA